MLNEWIVQEDPAFGAWEWVIPFEHSSIEHAANECLLLLQEFLVMSEETGIWGVHEVWSGVEEYCSDVRAYWAKNGMLRFGNFPEVASMLDETRKRRFTEKGYWRGNMLTYFGKIDLQTAWIADAGTLLRTLYPSESNISHSGMDLYPALYLWSGSLNRHRRDNPHVLVFGARLHANIWFPELPELPEKPHWSLPENDFPFQAKAVIDNTLLSSANAGRLRQWLTETHALVRHFGGDSKFIRPQQEFYRPFINGEGIKV
jgi:hypothetical protein